jgi:hypothetical protein
VDGNGNGKIEYSEFCLLMCQLAKKQIKGGLPEAMHKFRYLYKLSTVGPIIVQYKNVLLSRGTSYIAPQHTSKADQYKPSKSQSKPHSVSPDTGKNMTFTSLSSFDLSDAGDKGSYEENEDDNDMMMDNDDDEDLENTMKDLQKKQSSCLSCFSFISKRNKIAMEMIQKQLASKKNVGPHGRYCLCGCRYIPLGR